MEESLEGRFVDNHETVRSDRNVLRSTDFAEAMDTAHQVSFFEKKYFAGENDLSLESVIGRLALRAFVALARADVLPGDMIEDDPMALGVGALFPDDDHLQACAIAMVKGNFLHTPRRMAANFTSLRSAPSSRVS